GSNTVTVNDATNVTGSASYATTVAVGGKTVTGVYALAHSADVLDATNGASSAGATTAAAERLSLAGAITMRAEQYAAFNNGAPDSIAAAGSNDTIVLTTALASGVTLNAGVEKFTLATGAHNVVLGATGQTVNA